MVNLADENACGARDRARYDILLVIILAENCHDLTQCNTGLRKIADSDEAKTPNVSTETCREKAEKNQIHANYLPKKIHSLIHASRHFLQVRHLLSNIFVDRSS